MILWLKFLHLIFMVTWFAALFYLPRLFVYHTDVKLPEEHERFKTMEHKLFWYICIPSSVLVLITGLWSIFVRGMIYFENSGWLHLKLAGVFALFIYQYFCWRWLQNFKRNQNPHSGKFFRIVNEVPTIFLLGILYLVIFKPF